MRTLEESRCPNCSGLGLEELWRVAGIPTHSCLLMGTRKEARDFPTGDMCLGWCGRCGFATNVLFDVRHNAYSTRYEEVQTCSPTFNRFASSLVERLVEKSGVRGKRVVEIGCGKGEFLLELCERGGNDGVGIDPSYLPGRRASEAVERVKFINELYSAERHAGIEADVIVCRHTLEHIQPVAEFMETVRRSIGDREDVLVFFELPDQERVYRDLAFWDVYYEHCSYFTSEALAHVFGAAGFEVLDLWKGFDDQYLLIEARPVPIGRSGQSDGVSTAQAKLARDFANRLPGYLDELRGRVAKAGENTAIWGAGSKGVAFLTSLGVANEIQWAVDINPNKHGYFMPGTGHEVVGPGRLVEAPPDTVFVMNAIYEDEIKGTLLDLGLDPELVCL